MSTLTPGATYIYERANGVTYAREFGAAANTRVAVGYDYDLVTGHKIDYDKRTADGRPLHEHIMEDKMWGEIRRAAKTNPTLQDALDRVIMIHNLSKTHE